MTVGAGVARPFQIVADSGCNLPPWLIRRFDVATIPTAYYAKGEPRVELLYDAGAGFNADDFYARMISGENFTVDSLDSSTCERFLTPLIEESGGDILFLFSSSEVFSNAESIQLYFDEMTSRYPGRNFIAVDTLSVGLGFGRLLMQVCELREEGASIYAVAQWLKNNRLGVCQWFLVKDGQKLLHVNNSGKLYPPVETARGNTLLDAYRHRSKRPYYQHSPTIVHASNIDAAMYLAAQLDEHFELTKPMIYDIEPGLGSKLGPGALGLIFWGGPR
ncbi:MAG: DegV family protein [Coriobacteriia bacterium]|nr:DegV family protein [Coriobacteriia bacterium]